MLCLATPARSNDLFDTALALEARVARARAAQTPDPLAPAAALLPPATADGADPIAVAARRAVLDALARGEPAAALALHAALADRASLLTLADAACLLHTSVDALEDLTAHESAHPPHTLTGRVAPPGSSRFSSSAHIDAASLDASVARVGHALGADAPVLVAPAPDAPCSMEHPLRLAGLVLAPAGDWLDAHDALHSIWTQTPPPRSWLIRLATHRYLATDWRSLALLWQLEGEGLRADDLHTQALHALALLAARRWDALADPSPLSEAPDVWLRWVAAEMHRVRGELRQARALLDAIVTEDPFFVGAQLSRASVRIAQGEASEVHTDLAFLRQGWGGTRAYGAWIDALARRLQ